MNIRSKNISIFRTAKLLHLPYSCLMWHTIQSADKKAVVSNQLRVFHIHFNNLFITPKHEYFISTMISRYKNIYNSFYLPVTIKTKYTWSNNKK